MFGLAVKKLRRRRRHEARREAVRRAVAGADRALLAALVLLFSGSMAIAVTTGLETRRAQTLPAYAQVIEDRYVPAVSFAYAIASEAAAERRCLTKALYYEARGEPREGTLAIARVIFQRVRSEGYPQSVCGVVFQGSDRRTGCQFSFTCSGAMRARRDEAAWAEADALARRIMAEPAVLDEVRVAGATHFHAVTVDPVWADTYVRVAQIGNHIFYRPGRRPTS